MSHQKLSLSLLFFFLTLLTWSDMPVSRILVQYRSQVADPDVFHGAEQHRFLNRPDSRAARDNLLTAITGIQAEDSFLVIPEPCQDACRTKLKHLVLYRLPPLPVEQGDKILNLLEEDPAVEYAEPDYLLKGCLVPDDPYYSLQWALETLGASQAWEVSTGDAGVIVGVMDSGVKYNHPELAGVVLPGYDFVNSDADPMDDSESNHGTLIAGVIAARGNNGIGISGIAWKTKILPIKTLNHEVTGSVSSVIRGIDYAISKGVTVLNMSFGMYDYSYFLYQALVRARDAGILLVCAAGNGGEDFLADDNDLVPYYPASFELDNIIAVAGVDEQENAVVSSNYGLLSVDLAAPGIYVYSLTGDDEYRYGSGTSVAAPHVTGAAALLKAAAPRLGYRELKEIILDTTLPVPAFTGKVLSGGRLHLAQALAAVDVEFLLGDMNGSGVVDIIDALAAARYYVGHLDAGMNLLAGDVDRDGEVTILDALMIAQYYVGSIDW